MTDQQKIHACLQYLAGVCDGAVKKDGVGFNGLDTGYGKSLALAPALSPAQAIAGLKLIQRYRKQLEGAGLVVPDLEVAETLEKQQAQAGLMIRFNQRIHVRFGGIPSADVRAELKKIQGWRFEGELPGKPWSFPLTAFDQLTVLLPAIPVDQELSDFVQSAEPADTPRMVLDVWQGQVIIRFPYDGKPPENELEKVRSLPVRRWEKDLPGSPWSTPLEYFGRLVEYWPDAEITAPLKQALADHGLRVALSRAETSDYEVSNAGGELRPYQRAAVHFLELSGGRALIADDQGLGKTIEALAYLQQHPELRPVLVICPSSVKINWLRETRKWVQTNGRVEILQGRQPYPTTADIVIINWDILAYWKKHFADGLAPQVIIADESQYAKNQDAKRTKALIHLVTGKVLINKRWQQEHLPVRRFIALTGTPITSRPIDFYTTLNMLSPAKFGNRHRFGLDYCGGYHNGFGWQYDGSSNADRLHELIKPFVVRRKKADVLKELPPKIYAPLILEISNRAEYEHIYVETMRVIRTAQEQGRPISAAHLKLVEKLKQLAAQGKMGELIPWVGDIIQNEKLLVFCTHHKIVDQFLAAYPGVSVEITGRVVGDKRQDAIDRFQTDDSVRLCVANIQAGGIGLTLTAASKVLFVEFPWNPKEIDQAVDRTHRIGQDQQVTAYFAAGVDTIEENIIDLLIEKAAAIDRIMDGGEAGELSVIQEFLYAELGQSAGQE